MMGDKRMTDSFCDQVEEILQSLNSDDGKPQPEHNVGLCLPQLPAPLETLNGRTLQSILIAIAKISSSSGVVKSQCSGLRICLSATHVLYLRSSEDHGVLQCGR